MLARARSLFSRVFSADATLDVKSDMTTDPRLHKPSESMANGDDDDWPAEFCLSPSAACGDQDRTKAPVRYRRSSYDKTRQYRLVNAMQIATSRGNVEAMKRLLNNLDIDINHRDQYGMSYVEQAILMGSADMVDLLIRYGCDMSQGDSHDHSYLYVAIETTTHKSPAVIRCLLESNCRCLNANDLSSLTCPTQLLHINADDFLLLNGHLTCIFKYQMHRMDPNDVLALIVYFIRTNLLLQKNEEYFALSSSASQSLLDLNDDYVSLATKILAKDDALRLEDQLKHAHLFRVPSQLIPVTSHDVQSCVNRLIDSKEQVPPLRHLCRLIVRRRLKNLKPTTLDTLLSTAQLRDYLLYTPI